ncbi:hypothetical protein ACO2Q3_26640 [Caulobacter sp. KR2-114]|uniref:hypothetical protein n=1 Tax=Caulobacter sp. KR2-114 TaxID=3400912 RepID=UPI003C05E141
MPDGEARGWGAKAMIAERIQIAPTRAARRAADGTITSTIDPMMSALASAAPAARRGLLGLLLRAAATGGAIS